MLFRNGMPLARRSQALRAMEPLQNVLREQLERTLAEMDANGWDMQFECQRAISLIGKVRHAHTLAREGKIASGRRVEVESTLPPVKLAKGA